MKKIKRLYRAYRAKIKRILGIVSSTQKEKALDCSRFVLRSITGGPVYYRHLESLYIKDFQKRFDAEFSTREDIEEEYFQFSQENKALLEQSIRILRKQGIKISHTKSEGKNPKDFYYLKQTRKNIEKARSVVLRNLKEESKK